MPPLFDILNLTMRSRFDDGLTILDTLPKRGFRSNQQGVYMKRSCGFLLASLVAGAASAQTIVNFTAVETSGPNIGQEILGSANGSSIVVTNGSIVWSSVETAGQIGQQSGGDLGRYFFYSPTQQLDISLAQATSDVHTTPGPINLSDFRGGATYTFTQWSSVPNQIAYQIQYAVTSATVAVSAAVTAVSKPTLSAPEIDPASAASALALLISGCLVVRGKKAKPAASAI
jgi:hypothetical protein